MRRLLIIAPLASLVGCSVSVNDLLTTAEANVVESDESPGGDDEPDTPGEGEGEGQDPEDVDDDGDPACEANERLLVVRDQEVDALRVYALDDGGLLRRFPAGTTANVNVDNDDAAAQSNGWGLTGVALGQDQDLYVVGDRFLYRFDSRDLTQQTLTGRVQVTLESFGQASFVEVIGDSVLTFGDNVRRLPQDAEVGAAAELLHQGDDYLGTTTFRIGTTHYAAASASYGYVVIAAEEGGPPQVVQVLDTEFDASVKHLLDTHLEQHEQFSRFLHLYFTDRRQTLADPFLLRAVQTVETNLADPDFMADELARKLQMTKNHCFRKLKTLTGKEPMQLIREMRLVKAKVLLEKRAGTPHAIAEMVGFSNPGTFSLAFKEYFGDNTLLLGR